MFLLWALWLLWLWQPERQVRLHTTHFLKKVEQRNWNGARSFLAEDFKDRWGHDANASISDAHEVFSHFLFLTIENRTDHIDWQGADGTARTVVKITGTGDPIAQMVMERVNTLHEPFAFTWRRTGRAPWAWKLVFIDDPALNIDTSGAF